MEITTGVLISLIFIIISLLFEYRISKPDILVLFEKKGQIQIRRGLFYPRHLSLVIDRTTHPIQLDTQIAAAGNLMASIKLVGSAAPSLAHLTALISVGGWNKDAVARAADEAQILLQSFMQSYAGDKDLQSLSSTGILDYLNEKTAFIKEKLGIEIVSLGILTLEPSDPEIALALRQQEQARLMEQTERLNQQARAAAAKAKNETDKEIIAMEYALGLEKAELDIALVDKEAELTRQRVEHELAQKRLQLEFEKEEVELIKNSPELLMLTPQAARLAEASQNLKNARTIVSFTPQDLAQGSELFELFQALLQKALDAKKSE